MGVSLMIIVYIYKFYQYCGDEFAEIKEIDVAETKEDDFKKEEKI